MNASRLLVATAVATGLLAGSKVFAQHHHGHNHYTPRYHVDHHNHTVRDNHGHVIGRYHHDVIHPSSSYVLPHSSGHHHGTYYAQSGSYYYYPQTASRDPHVYQDVRPVQMTFGGFAQVEDLASRLEVLANEFCLDLHYNYSHNPGYQETYREAYQVMEVAKFIHAAEHQQDRQAIASRLGGIDQLFHHVQDDVRGWSRHHHRQIGQLGILSKMDLIESTLHHLMNDVGVAESPTGNEQAPPPAGGSSNEQAPPPLGTAPAPISSPPPGL